MGAGNPQGYSRDLMTFVRSLATEKVVHGGANIAARTRPFRMSAMIRFLTTLEVRSNWLPLSNSHSLALYPNLRHW